jgi:NADPH:quinone reductase-like Zn-dependent oxidoreductase
MKAIVYAEYGPPEVLKLQEVEKPTPKDDQLLIRNYATPVSSGDLIARRFGQIPPREFGMPLLMYLPARLDFGLSKPKKGILGSEFSGEVEAVRRSPASSRGTRCSGISAKRWAVMPSISACPKPGLWPLNRLT